MLQQYSCRIDFLTCQFVKTGRLFRQEKALGSAERLAEEGLARVGPMAESPDHGAKSKQKDFVDFEWTDSKHSRFQPTQKENERAKKRDPKQVAVT